MDLWTEHLYGMALETADEMADSDLREAIWEAMESEENSGDEPEDREDAAR